MENIPSSQWELRWYSFSVRLVEKGDHLRKKSIQTCVTLTFQIGNPLQKLTRNVDQILKFIFIDNTQFILSFFTTEVEQRTRTGLNTSYGVYVIHVDVTCLSCYWIFLTNKSSMLLDNTFVFDLWCNSDLDLLKNMFDIVSP